MPLLNSLSNFAMEGRVLGRGTGGTMKHRLENLAAANNLARIGSPPKKKRRGRKRLQTGRGRKQTSTKKRKCKTAKRRKRSRI